MVAGMLVMAATAHAQINMPATYDVSTVKPAAPGNRDMRVNWADAELKADNVTLEWMMGNVFHARTDQISGVPSWAKNKHFDIRAKLTDTSQATLEKMTTDQHRALMLTLLVERFGLKYHVETKELPTYDLVPAKNGLRLTPATNPGDKTKQVNGMCDGCSYRDNNGVQGHDISVPVFAELLAGQLGRNVHDGTGYTARIDVNLKWAPDLDSTLASDEDGSLLPLPQALEKQMGLHLVSTRSPVTLYVIDHLDEPSPN
jgi:uncharacterized protein (TIGR03435 family)